MTAPLAFPGRLTFDANLELKDAGLVAASAAATVDESAKVVDLGSTGPSTLTSGVGFTRGDIVIDVTALEIASDDEIYKIVVQLSSDSDFGTDTNIVDAMQLTLAAAEVQESDANADDVIGRYILPFHNWYAETLYRYMRLYTIVAGTIASGINYSAYLSRQS
jgi:hypothetical protein